MTRSFSIFLLSAATLTALTAGDLDTPNISGKPNTSSMEATAVFNAQQATVVPGQMSPEELKKYLNALPQAQSKAKHTAKNVQQKYLQTPHHKLRRNGHLKQPR